MEKRLTKKETTGDYVFVDGEIACPNEIARKIGELEDIEERYLIDFATVIEALIKGIYVKEDNGIRFIEPHKLSFAIATPTVSVDTYIFLEEGNNSAISAWSTWALTKKELENIKEKE